jgi:hypothetical protein
MGNEGFAGEALLPGMLQCRELIRTTEQCKVLTGAIGLDLAEYVFELDHTF